MSPLREMQARWAQAGRVERILLRPTRRGEMVAQETAKLSLAGPERDHGRGGKRAVTLIQQEHLAAIGSVLGEPPVDPRRLRRNLVVAGINLAALRGRSIAVGSAEVEITVPCAPCSRMEEEFGPGGYSAVRGHGGWCARVLTSGPIAIGDEVRPL